MRRGVIGAAILRKRDEFAREERELPIFYGKMGGWVYLDFMR